MGGSKEGVLSETKEDDGLCSGVSNLVGCLNARNTPILASGLRCCQGKITATQIREMC